MTSKRDIRQFLLERPGYLKKGAWVLARRLECSVKDCQEVLKELRNANTSENRLDREDRVKTSSLQKFLTTHGINEASVSSVKFWQTATGDLRYSVVTNDAPNTEDIKQEIEDFAADYAPVYPEQDYPECEDPIAYEISLPDIHYGKLVDMPLPYDFQEKEYITVVENLVAKAAGLEIERFILPIGNDGLNSEGMRMTTTKGTPQQDYMDWRKSFRGYWKLIVYTIDYLKQIAPVDVIVVSGNHDYERMYYVGDVIAGWFRNDPNVSVDNSDDPRKYYQYGTNMLMFTHGDKEKAQNIPLIMATEQPEMFAATSHREAHCGHFHKEQVNEYRGIKVRFVPSICPNDSWHKQMGYDSKRTGQAYIWSKERGMEGYNQYNV
jgi:hypothetical protein